MVKMGGVIQTQIDLAVTATAFFKLRQMDPVVLDWPRCSPYASSFISHRAPCCQRV